MYNNKNNIYNIIKGLNYKLKAATEHFLNFTIKFFIYVVTLIAHFEKAVGRCYAKCKKMQQSNTFTEKIGKL